MDIDLCLHIARQSGDTDTALAIIKAGGKQYFEAATSIGLIKNYKVAKFKMIIQISPIFVEKQETSLVLSLVEDIKDMFKIDTYYIDFVDMILTIITSKNNRVYARTR